MDPMAAKLAALRLAPVQVAAWGHPETTGLPTIDHYLSAELLEPEGAQAHYTEALVRLPNLGCCYEAPAVQRRAPDLAELGIDAGVPLLLCPGVPFKYAPQHDAVLVQIAQHLGRCQLIFFTHRLRACSEQLQRRLAAAFAGAGLDFGAFGRFVPWQDKPAFYGLLERCDVFLDTIGFSGFNTAMQALECGLPVVTKDGRFLRGKLASGLLRRIGLTQLIASSDAQYVDLVVRLANDAAYRQVLRQRICAARGVLFGDTAPVHALEQFLASAVAAEKAHSISSPTDPSAAPTSPGEPTPA
jgi:predicted O-linked N-acetylglucosamine transferase (SPINDLY family)